MHGSLSCRGCRVDFCASSAALMLSECPGNPMISPHTPSWPSGSKFELMPSAVNPEQPAMHKRFNARARKVPMCTKVSSVSPVQSRSVSDDSSGHEVHNDPIASSVTRDAPARPNSLSMLKRFVSASNPGVSTSSPCKLSV